MTHSTHAQGHTVRNSPSSPFNKGGKRGILYREGRRVARENVWTIVWLFFFFASMVLGETVAPHPDRMTGDVPYVQGVQSVQWGQVASAAAPSAERDYQEPWCHRHAGKVEHVLPDRTRVDCLTKTHAIEFDFGRKWAQAIGQALHYARLTGLRAGIVLIVVDAADERGAARLREVIEEFKLPIDLWIVTE